MIGMSLSISLLVGIAIGSFAWSFRNGIKRRADRDVAWLDEIRLRFNPNITDSHKYVYWMYGIQFVVILPTLLYLITVKVLALAIWLLFWMLPQVIANYKWKKRLKVLDEQLPVMIRRLGSLLGSGLSFAQALRQMSDDFPPPMMYECMIMSQGWEMGENFDGIVASTAERLELPSFQLFSVIVIMNNQLGGNIVKTLEKLSESLESQNAMNKEIRAATAEGRATIWGLLAAPPLMLGIVTFIDSKSVGELFSTWLGFGILGVASVIIMIGYIWARRIVHFEY